MTIKKHISLLQKVDFVNLISCTCISATYYRWGMTVFEGTPVLPSFILMLLVQPGGTPYCNLYGEAPPGQRYPFQASSV